ncbi:MAG: metal-dependent transcriptional regulator [Ignavibacteriaceae bacterium]|nr:metal-dependent transcriptional regulator [Ignavibacteriaceae bacterium]
MKNISKEDYLSEIYKNSDENGQVKANLIAEKLQVSNAAVTDMLKKLKREGQIKYEPYRGVELTSKGKEYAKNMVRRHRIWEVFLHQIVGLPWDKVHDEAHHLEHSGSDELINKMEEMLNFPQFDPHGDPIPSKLGIVPEQKHNVALSNLKQNQKGVVIRVNDFDNNFLIYISQIGIKLKKEIKVCEVLNFDKSILVEIDGKKNNLSRTIAENIFVEIKK